MRKRILIIALISVLSICLTGCDSRSYLDSLNEEIAEMQLQKSELQNEISQLENMVVEKKIETGTEKYVLTLQIKQVHITTSISTHLKDAMNAMEIEIPVDKEYYDSLEVGQMIVDEVRMGSLVFKGSIGSFRIEVIDKEVR